LQRPSWRGTAGADGVKRKGEHPERQTKEKTMLNLLIGALVGAAGVHTAHVLVARARSYRVLRAVITRLCGRTGGGTYSVEYDYVMLGLDTILKLRATAAGVTYTMRPLCESATFASGIARDTQESIDEIDSAAQACAARRFAMTQLSCSGA